MFFISGPSAWRWETSGGAGISVDVEAVSEGVLKLFDPARKRQTFLYGEVGARLSTPGLKLPILGGIIGKLLSGHVLNGSGSPTSFWNEGTIFKGGAPPRIASLPAPTSPDPVCWAMWARRRRSRAGRSASSCADSIRRPSPR